MIALIAAVTLSLFDAQTQALAHSPVVAAARQHVAEAEAQVRIARGTGAPSAVASYAESPQANAANIGSTQQKITTVGGQMSVSDLVSRSPQVAQANAALAGAQADEREAERQERIKVIGLYIDAQRTHEVRILRESIAKAALDDERAADQRRITGEGPRVDVWRAEVAHFQADADVHTAIADEHTALTALALETGVDASSVVLPSLPNLEPGVPHMGNALDVALAKRPEILSAQADVEDESAAVRVAQRTGLPTLTAQLGYAYGVDTAINVSGPAATLTLALPLNGTPAATVAAERARRDQALSRLTAAQQHVTLDVQTAFDTLNADVYQAFTQRIATDTAMQEVKATEIGFRSGASSSLELIDARRTYDQAAIDELTARASLNEAEDTWPLMLGEMP